MPVNPFYQPCILALAHNRRTVPLLHSHRSLRPTVSVHDTSIDGFRRYSQIREALCQQILTAIDPTYYNVLKDATFGYADLTVVSLLSHLEITYATLSADDLEFNHMRLADAWTPDEPLEQANVYAHSLRTWHDRASNDHTWANFCSHFIHGDKEHLPMLTATTAGYHGAHAAIQTSGHTPQPGFHQQWYCPYAQYCHSCPSCPNWICIQQFTIRILLDSRSHQAP